VATTTERGEQAECCCCNAAASTGTRNGCFPLPNSTTAQADDRMVQLDAKRTQTYARLLMQRVNRPPFPHSAGCLLLCTGALILLVVDCCCCFFPSNGGALGSSLCAASAPTAAACNLLFLLLSSADAEQGPFWPETVQC
jgi:hypothetical protein